MGKKIMQNATLSFLKSNTIHPSPPHGLLFTACLPNVHIRPFQCSHSSPILAPMQQFFHDPPPNPLLTTKPCVYTPYSPFFLPYPLLIPPQTTIRPFPEWSGPNISQLAKISQFRSILTSCTKRFPAVLSIVACGHWYKSYGCPFDFLCSTYHRPPSTSSIPFIKFKGKIFKIERFELICSGIVLNKR